MLKRAWAIGFDFALFTWRRATPLFVGLFGLGFGCLAVNEATDEPKRIGLFIASGMILWAIDLAYERGEAAAGQKTGLMIAKMVSGESDVTITVTHVHTATPEAAAIIRAQELAS